MVNSIFESMSIRIYMKHDFLIKAGSFGTNMYVILDGEALLFGINKELLGIMRSGTHFGSELG